MLCIKLVNYWDKYTEMHGQQNVKISYKSYNQLQNQPALTIGCNSATNSIESLKLI